MKNFEIGAAYIRVSTDDQTEYSPDAQLRSIKDYCKKNEIVMPDKNIFIDEGISGRKAEKRPAFMKMISQAKTNPKPFDVIMVHKFDRFARNREDSVVYKSLLRKDCGIKVISITENIEDDKFSIILESMLEAMAEYYSINLSEEVKKGMTEKAKRGEPQTIAPFGYIMQNKQFIINENEANIVKMLFEKFAGGQSYLELAKQLNDMGILTHRGNLFENRTIEYILKNPVYIGMLRWNPSQRSCRNYEHPDLIIAHAKHTPIVTEDLFNQVQNRISKIKKINKPYYKINNKPSHWLVGLICCGACNSGMVKNGINSFQCNGYIKGRCKISHSISIKKLETCLLNEIKNIVENNNLQHINLINYKSKNFDNESELIILQNQLKKTDAKLQRIKKAFVNGIDTISEYKDNKEIITNEINCINNKINDIQKEYKKNNNQEQYIIFLTNQYKTLTSSATSMEEKYKASHSFIHKIIFNKENFELLITLYI